MAEVELVPVLPEHAPTLLALARAFHAEDGHPLTATGEAAIGLIARGHPLGRAWLVRERGAIVGYTVLCLGFGIEYGGPDAFIDDLYLVPAARGRGLGRAVLRQLEAQARGLGLAALFLVVAPDNRRARALYDDEGFERTDWLLMAKRL